MTPTDRRKHHGVLRIYHSQISFVYRLADGACIALALWVCARALGVPWSVPLGLVATLGVMFFYFVAEYVDLYRLWHISSTGDEIRRLLWAWLGVVSALFLAAVATEATAGAPRGVIVAWLAAAPLPLVLQRLAARGLGHRLGLVGHFKRTAAIVGAGDLGVRIARTLSGMSWMNLDLVGFYDDYKASGERPAGEAAPAVVGNLDSLVQSARGGQLDVIYLALPMRAEGRIGELLRALADTTASVYLVPDIYRFHLLNIEWREIGNLPLLTIYETPLDGLGGVIKRIEDLLLGSMFLLAAAFPMAVIAVAIRLSSPGPVLFKQRRYGFNGEVVRIWKFRTMTVLEDGDEFSQARKADPRVTPLGSLLRRTSLDELPQLFNVVGGSMSLVGPRPHPIALNEEFRGQVQDYMLRHKIKPGITGLAQVNGRRGETDTVAKMCDRVRYDLDYIRNWSLMLDLKILARTVGVVLGGENAH